MTVRSRATVLAKIAAWSLLTLVLLAAAGVWLARTEWGRHRLLTLIERQVAPFVDGELRIGRLNGSLYGSADLHDVQVIRDGSVVLSVARISGTYRLGQLLGPDLVVDSLVLTEPRLTITETPDEWRVEGVVVPPGDPATPSTGTVSLRRVSLVNGHVQVRPMGLEYDLEALEAEADVEIARHITVDVRRFAAREARGGLTVTRLTTHVVVTDDRTTLDPLDVSTPASRVRGSLALLEGGVLDAEVRSDALPLPEWQAYAPALDGITLAPAVDLRLRGPLDALHVTGLVTDLSAGRADVDLVADLGGVFAARGRARLTDFDVAPWAVRPDLPTRLTGEVQFDLRDDEAGQGLTGTFAATLGRSRYQQHRIERAQTSGTLTPDRVAATFDAAAYGAASTGTLTYVFDTETSTVTGRLRAGDASTLPAFMNLPPLETDLQGDYTLVMSPAIWRVESTLDASTIEGAAIEPGMIVRLTITGDTEAAYFVSGVLQGLDPQRLAPKLRDPADEPIEWPFEAARVSGQVTVEGAGALEADLIDHAATFSGVLDLDVDEALLRGVSVSGALASRRLSMAAEGAAAGVWNRLARWEGAAIRPDGTFSATVTVPDLAADPGPLYADGTLEFTLGASHLAGVDVTSARLQAALRAGVVTIAQGAVSARAGRLDMTGTVALGDTATSDLAYLVDLADLALLPEDWGLGLSGQVRTEGRLTGAFEEPTLRGTAQGATLAMETLSILSASGEYTVRVPEWLPERLSGTASVEAAFVEAGGLTWPAARVSARFDAVHADLTATAEHAHGVIDVTGLVRSLEHETVELAARTATIRMPGETWTLQAPLVVRMTADRLSVDRAELTQGAGRIVVAGAIPFSAPGADDADRLRVEVSGVEVSPLVAALLGDQRVRGTLAGTAVVSGALDDPHLDSSFTLSDGEADGVPFRSVGGTARVAGSTAALDIRLDAGVRGTASIAGVMPLEASVDGVDLRVFAELSDVGVVAPALVFITDASGAAHADLQVTGRREALRIDGAATLTDVRFAVPETGVSYRRLTAAMRVEDSVLIVDRFTVEDPDGHVLRVNGRLDVLARNGGGEVDLRVVARDFRLLANRFGDLSVHMDLTAAGTLTAPQMIGTVRIERGRFEVDQLLQQFTPSSAYVAAADPVAPPTDPHAAPVPPSVFSGAALSIDVVLPDNVVVRGRGLQTEDGPIGLGDINLTLGGTLQVVKQRGADAGLVGQVNVVRGTYDFQGRRFAIERGSLMRFRGDDYTNPSLDIRATREVSGVTVRARIQGTAAAPTLTLSSEPPLDEGDILALVVFNRPINQLGEGERISLAARAGGLAAGALVGPIADSVARALDLDVFEIQTAEAGTTGATVTVGRQISDRLFVGFRHEFGGEGANRLSFEYRLTEYLRLMTSFAPGAQPANRSARTEAAGIDLIFVIRR